jgi:hypothetical protein
MSYVVGYTDGMRRLNKPGKLQRVSLDLPEPLYEKVRTLAFERKQSMNLILVEAISQCLPEPVEKTTTDRPQDGTE